MINHVDNTDVDSTGFYSTDIDSNNVDNNLDATLAITDNLPMPTDTRLLKQHTSSAQRV